LAAANSLRGPVDPAAFKAYIFPLLFYKRVCDTWDDEHAKATADYKAGLTPEIEADYHRFQVPTGAHWRDLRRVTENVGVALRNNLDRIQQANPDTLAGIFGHVEWGNKEKLAPSFATPPWPPVLRPPPFQVSSREVTSKVARGRHMMQADDRLV
jgi:type I restriction enzyme M protein